MGCFLQTAFTNFHKLVHKFIKKKLNSFINQIYKSSHTC